MRPQRSTAVVFAAVLCAAALLWTILPFPAPQFWGASLLVAVALAAAARRVRSPRPSTGEFLCDHCRYDDPRYCSRPERPNASRCADYRGRG